MKREIVVQKEARTGIWFRFAVNAVGLYLTAAVIPGVQVSGVFGAIIAALVLTLVNTFVRPILFVLTLPMTILTFGLFALVVNGVSLLLAAWFAGSAFSVDGLGPAILAWLLLSLLNWGFTSLFKREQVRYR